MTNHNQGKQQKYIEMNGQMLRLKQCNRCHMPIYKYGSQRYEVINNNMVKLSNLIGAYGGRIHGSQYTGHSVAVYFELPTENKEDFLKEEQSK